MGRFLDPTSYKKSKKMKLALACLLRTRDIKEDEYGSYFFDEDHLKKVLEAKCQNI